MLVFGGEPSALINWRDLWTLQQLTGQIVHEFKGHTGPVRCLDVGSFDEALFVSGARDNRARVWRLDREECMVSVSELSCLQRRLCRGQVAKSIYVFCTQKVYSGHSEAVAGVKFLQSGSRVCSMARSIHLWDVERASMMSLFEYSEGFTAFATSEWDQYMIAATELPSLHLYDMRCRGRSAEWDLDLPLYARPMVRSVAVHPNGTLLAVGFSSGVLSLMDKRAGTVQQTFRAHSQGSVLDVHFVDSDPHLMVTSCSDRSLGVWDVSTSRARSVAFWKDELPDPAHSLCFVDNYLFAISSRGISVGHVQQHGSVTPETTGIKDVKITINCGQIEPLSHLLLLGCEDGAVRVCT